MEESKVWKNRTLGNETPQAQQPAKAQSMKWHAFKGSSQVTAMYVAKKRAESMRAILPMQSINAIINDQLVSCISVMVHHTPQTAALA
jgi:hypothetical protein